MKKSKKKITTSKLFDIFGTKFCNIMPSYIINLPIKLFKKKISQWNLKTSCNIIIFCYINVKYQFLNFLNYLYSYLLYSFTVNLLLIIKLIYYKKLRNLLTYDAI